MKELTITVAAAPNAVGRRSNLLAHEIRILKSAILYADRVRLVSPTAGLFLNVFDLTSLAGDAATNLERLLGMAALVSELSGHDFGSEIALPKKVSSILRKSKILWTKADRVLINRFESTPKAMWDAITEDFQKKLHEIGFTELQKAIQSGLVDVHRFKGIGVPDVGELADVLGELVKNPSSHPMFDELTMAVVQEGIAKGVFETPKLTANSKSTGLVAELFKELPVLDLPIDEIVTIRGALTKPLTAFRSEVVKISNDFNSTPWDTDFPSEVEIAYHRQIAPTLQEIDDTVRSLSLPSFISKKVVEKSSFAALSVSSFGLAAAFSPWVGVLSGLVLGGALLKSTLAEYNEKMREVERNGLYFYYKLNQK